MNVGLFFGSFNPIHVGHLIIADHIAGLENIDEVWFVVSPQNPHKEKKTLLADHHRLMLVKEAVDNNPRLRASDIEFALPVPSYTVKTLAHLKETYPDHSFSLIMGEDNLRTLHKWYNYEEILEGYQILVYPRVLTVQELDTPKDQGNGLRNHANIKLVEDVPVMKVSSSAIRRAIKEGRDVRYLLTEPVYKYVDEMNFYK
jgi:nicotinate-nucleotide adenylyltransferase